VLETDTEPLVDPVIVAEDDTLTLLLEDPVVLPEPETDTLPEELPVIVVDELTDPVELTDAVIEVLPETEPDVLGLDETLVEPDTVPSADLDVVAVPDTVLLFLALPVPERVTEEERDAPADLEFIAVVLTLTVTDLDVLTVLDTVPLTDPERVCVILREPVGDPVDVLLSVPLLEGLELYDNSAEPDTLADVEYEIPFELGIADCVEDCDSFPFLLAKEVAEEDIVLPPVLEGLTEDVELIVTFKVLEPVPDPVPDLLTETLAVLVIEPTALRVDVIVGALDLLTLEVPVGDLLLLLVLVSNPPTEQPNFFWASLKPTIPKGPL
jgi:hypothetical protein